MMQNPVTPLVKHEDNYREGSAPVLSALAALSIVLGTQSTVLRFWARSKTGGRIQGDDWLTVPAWAATVAAASLVFFLISQGSLGYAFKFRTPEEIADTAPAGAISLISFNTLSIFCFGATKASALLFYRRFFCAGGKNPNLNKVILGAVPFMGLWTVVFALLTIFQCGTHWHAAWDDTYNQYCVLSYPSIEGMAATDVILDLFVISLPIHAVSRLATSRQSKLALGSIFLIALVGLAASIARLVLVTYVAKKGHNELRKDTDYYMSITAFYWMLEMGVSVVVVSLPPIWTALDSRIRLPSEYEDLEGDSN